MPEKTRTQKQYDHRLSQLIQNTGDLDLAVRHGVPRSTARGWLRQARADVVSIDVLDLDAEALQREILYLRRRVTRLLTLSQAELTSHPAIPMGISGVSKRLMLPRTVSGEYSRVKVPKVVANSRVRFFR